ncbi:MAG: A24 family peptidase [Acidimicrobiia bacterium]|nr:A24 family peptidase [Acidimicrobiia bacterium]
MTAVLVGACGLAGLGVGALLLVMIERIPEHESLRVRPHPEIRAGMRTPDGWLVVIGTGALFAAMALRLGESWALPAYLVFTAGLVVLSVIDLRHQILPTRIVYPLAEISIVLLGVAAIGESDGEAFFRALACGLGAFLVFLLLHLVAPRGRGFGDVKLSFVFGVFLGWLGVGETVLGLFLGFVYGAVIGLILLATKVRSRQQPIPFGPFLAAGTITGILFGNLILDWYTG